MTIVFVGTAEKRTSSLAARINVEHKMRGFYKDHIQAKVNQFTGNYFRIVCIVLKITFLKLRYAKGVTGRLTLCSIMALARVNKVYRDFLHWQLLSLVCPLRNHATLLFSHQSFSACKDGGYREYGLLTMAFLTDQSWRAIKLRPCFTDGLNQNFKISV